MGAKRAHSSVLVRAMVEVMMALGRSMLAVNYAVQVAWATIFVLAARYLLPDVPLVVILVVGLLGFPIAYVVNRSRIQTLGLDEGIASRAQNSSQLFGLSVLAAGSAWAAYALTESLLHSDRVPWLTLFLAAQNLWLTALLGTQLERKLHPSPLA